ncbi:uncharacterized protein LOC134575928 [Pelobates fuscus]|uniref:uncharacterized protein LOC134575928 n=1 Tax=Pelobates fuscus TaxID=191477 RepID=UPI002FE438CF
MEDIKNLDNAMLLAEEVKFKPRSETEDRNDASDAEIIEVRHKYNETLFDEDETYNHDVERECRNDASDEEILDLKRNINHILLNEDEHYNSSLKTEGRFINDRCNAETVEVKHDVNDIAFDGDEKYNPDPEIESRNDTYDVEMVEVNQEVNNIPLDEDEKYNPNPDTKFRNYSCNAEMVAVKHDVNDIPFDGDEIYNPGPDKEFRNDAYNVEKIVVNQEVNDIPLDEDINYKLNIDPSKLENDTHSHKEILHLKCPSLMELFSNESTSSTIRTNSQDTDTNSRGHQMNENKYHQEYPFSGFRDLPSPIKKGTSTAFSMHSHNSINDTEQPVEFSFTASSCQEPAALKKTNLNAVLTAPKTREDNVEVKKNSQNLHSENNNLLVYMPGTFLSQQSQQTVKEEIYKNKKDFPLELTKEMLGCNPDVVRLIPTEKTTLNDECSLTMNLCRPQTATPGFEQEKQSDSASNSNVTCENPQNTPLSFSELKRLYSNIPQSFFHPTKKLSAIEEKHEQKASEDNYVFTPDGKLPLVTKSCENIHDRVSIQRPKLKNKTQSMLCLLTEYYSSTLHSSENGPIEEVSRGSFIRIPRGLQDIGEAVRFHLTLGNCLELLKFARKNSVPELLKAVYTVISDNYLHVLKNSAIYGQLSGLDRERILQLRMRRKPSLCVVEIKSIFGWNKTCQTVEETDTIQSKTQIYTLDMELNQWDTITSIPEEACLKGCSICSMHNYLFIAGGIQNSSGVSTCSDKLFCYNPLTDIWSQLTSMNQARSQLKLIPVDGHLYAIGGQCLQTVERYDPRLNKWTFRSPLPKGSFAVAHEATECGGEIYISGGHLFYRLLKYSPNNDNWEECPFNASRGRSCDMVAVKNHLYRFDMQRDSTVNIFKYNTTAKIWTEYSAIFPASKMPFRCVVLNNTIYCLNRETTTQFADGDGKAVFEPVVLSNFPTRGLVGTPYPFVLSLPGPISQTSV